MWSFQGPRSCKLASIEYPRGIYQTLVLQVVDGVRLSGLFDGDNFDTGSTESESQNPVAGSGISTGLRRLELPLPRRLEREIGKILALLRRTQCLICHCAIRIDRDLDHYIEFALNCGTGFGWNLGQHLFDHFAALRCRSLCCS